MSGESLREELLALPGVAEAEVDEQDGAPSGVRVRLSSDADARSVGVAVQRVLAGHGMKSRLTSTADEEPAEGSAEKEVPADLPYLPPPPAGDGDLPVPPLAPPSGRPPTAPPVAPGIGLASLAVEETPLGVSVTASDAEGRSVTAEGDATERGLFEAVVAAVGELADGTAPRTLLAAKATVEDSEVVTVVVERSTGDRCAGAALTRATAPYAVARATWVAIRG